jgi:cysteine desulfurase family protein (TIGR01976 family)
MSDYLLHHNANTHWNYPTSSETDAILESARRTVADFLGGDAEEVTFGANMTTLTFHVARALGRRWGNFDEVVITELDHHANIAPWKWLERERGVTVRTVRMNPQTGELDTDDLENQITSRTRLVAIGGASNALGTINDLPHVIAAARAAGALTFVDAVHLAPHTRLDVRELGCDLLACSPYKFYGPHLGVLWTRHDLIDALEVPRLDPAPDHDGERLETGTQNHEAIAGTAAAIDFLASLADGSTRRERLATAMHELHEAGQLLFASLWEGLRGLDGVTLFGPSPGRPRTPTLGFVVDNVPSSRVATQLAELGVFVSHGDFYATTVIERLGAGAEGLVRAGCACYTSPEEVQRLIDGVRDIAR